jgi:hypothetical protein
MVHMRILLQRYAMIVLIIVLNAITLILVLVVSLDIFTIQGILNVYQNAVILNTILIQELLAIIAFLALELSTVPDVDLISKHKNQFVLNVLQEIYLLLKTIVPQAAKTLDIIYL